jgi:hypothetical protein
MLVMLGQRRVEEYRSSSRSLRAVRLRSLGLRKAQHEGMKDKTLVLYVYHESGDTYADNFRFFVKVGRRLLYTTLTRLVNSGHFDPKTDDFLSC